MDVSPFDRVGLMWDASMQLISQGFWSLFRREVMESASSNQDTIIDEND